MTDAVIPKTGEWVLFRSDKSYDPVRVQLAQAEKVTPKLIKFVGRHHPRQCSILGVVASFADKADAERIQQSIDGVHGEYSRRRRAAEDERSRQITEAVTAANEQVRRIVNAA